MNRNMLTSLGLMALVGFTPAFAGAGNVLVPPGDFDGRAGLGIAPRPKPPGQLPKEKDDRQIRNVVPEPKVEPERPAPPQQRQETRPPLQSGGQQPLSLRISLTSENSFGEKDTTTISTKLGIPASRVSSACRLSFRGIMKTTAGNYPVSEGASRTATVRYEGTIYALTMQAQALCNASAVPKAKQGSAIRLHNNFLVPLQQIVCGNLIEGQFSDLLINYTGEDLAQCTLR